MLSVYVIRERVVVLKAVSSLPVDPPINLNLSWNPHKYAKNGWCHRVNPDTPFEEVGTRRETPTLSSSSVSVSTATAAASALWRSTPSGGSAGSGGLSSSRRSPSSSLP